MIDAALLGKIILIVVDEPHLRDALAIVFRSRGCEVIEAGSGNSAFKVTSERKIDFIISDVRMPDGDGVSLLTRLREVDPIHPKLLFVSGYADISPDLAVKKGAVGMIAK